MNLLDPKNNDEMAKIYEGLFIEDQKLIKSGKTRGFRFELVPSEKGWAPKTASCYSPGPNAVYFNPAGSRDVYVASELFNTIYIKDSINYIFNGRSEIDANGHTFTKIRFSPLREVDSALINRVVNMPVIVPSLNRVIQIVKAASHVLMRYSMPKDMRMYIINNYIFGSSNWRCLVENPFNRLAVIMELVWFDPKAEEYTLRDLQIEPHYGKVLVRISPEGKTTLDHAIGEDIEHHPIEQKPDGILICEGKQFDTLKDIVDTFSK